MIGVHEWGLYDFTVFTALYPCFLSDKGMLCYVWIFGGIHSLIIQLIKVCALTVEETAQLLKECVIVSNIKLL